MWSEQCQESFERLKSALTEAPILGYPSVNGTYILDTDASAFGVGAVLSQIQDDQERVITYYCVTRRELLPIVEAIKHCHYYLYGTPFKDHTDHAALSWLIRFKNQKGR